MCREFGVDDRVDPRIASLFAGGIGNTGSVCGAVIGGVMALGLLLERGETMEEMFRAYGVAAEFRQRFEAEAGEIGCRELTGADLSTPEGIEEYMGSEVPMMVCFPVVATAFRLVRQLLEENRPAEG